MLSIIGLAGLTSRRRSQLTSNVSHFMSFPLLRIMAISAIGFLAPLWWAWAVSNMTYGFYLLGGSPEHPSKVFAWSSILLPSALLGLATGTILSLICPKFWLGGWALLWVSLLFSTIAFGLANDIPTAGVSQLFGSFGNAAFLAGSLAAPLFFFWRGRRG